MGGIRSKGFDWAGETRSEGDERALSETVGVLADVADVDVVVGLVVAVLADEAGALLAEEEEEAAVAKVRVALLAVRYPVGGHVVAVFAQRPVASGADVDGAAIV